MRRAIHDADTPIDAQLDRAARSHCGGEADSYISQLALGQALATRETPAPIRRSIGPPLWCRRRSVRRARTC